MTRTLKFHFYRRGRGARLSLEYRPVHVFQEPPHGDSQRNSRETPPVSHALGGGVFQKLPG